jgi:hypothetical protein
MDSARSGPHRWFKRSITAVLAAIAVLASLNWWFTRPEISTRLVRIQGRCCTEYFDLKDGRPVQTECPSRGGESYDDSDRPINYSPGYPITYRDGYRTGQSAPAP